MRWHDPELRFHTLGSARGFQNVQKGLSVPKPHGPIEDFSNRLVREVWLHEWKQAGVSVSWAKLLGAARQEACRGLPHGRVRMQEKL